MSTRDILHPFQSAIKKCHTQRSRGGDLKDWDRSKVPTILSQCQAPKPPNRLGSRKSNASTPVPADEGPYVPTAADRLSYADSPRPFKSTTFVSKLPSRTATTSTSIVRKNAKQILILERERLSGGDGFLSAVHTAAKARGEVIDITKKKKASGGVGSSKPKGNIANLLRGRNLKNPRSDSLGMSVAGDDSASALPSGATTPAINENEDGDEDEEMESTDIITPDGKPGITVEDLMPKKEVITYHTPTAPPSLLPPKKYCDITGLHASYTDPRTKLRYKGLDVWHVVRGLGPGGDQAYLSLRGAQTSLK
ncbi:uncharacterized protein I303_104366 [Kwoniella dejecticola CBS 10117]|uniref:INO80 complex subunit C n=1 Tax=Kwoniella dejecticola CBS 10117 TaxID=1296121 RepID=A0A1A6A5I5_9TREE|nr:INO80 complex subunit C [Kwoniella dejecticola CBS 10117]OBR85323.1 INO80 complex subunit C [Kwoniella dejecticola CBS 10117]